MRIIAEQLELPGTRREWIDDAAPRLVMMLPTLGRFTSDDIHRLLPPPAHANWFGILVATLKNRGLVRKVGYKPSERKERNGGVISVWEAA